MRDFKSPAYQAMRRAVLRRDGHGCVFPGCGARRKLKVHHIRRYADSPGVGHSVQNCCTLCRAHHDLVTGREEEYVGLFTTIVGVAGDPVLEMMIERAHEQG